MRIRTILAAAAAPAALAAVLLGTAGQASAAVTAPQASISTQANQTQTATVSQTGVPDTTSGVNTGTDYGFGPVWASDNITRNIQVSPSVSTPGAWDVKFVENGQYNAFADPNTGQPWQNVGQMNGTITYTVTSPKAPDLSKLPPSLPGAVDANGDQITPGQPVANLPVTVHGHGHMLGLIFGGDYSVLSGPYSYHYTQIQDVPGVYKQVG